MITHYVPQFILDQFRRPALYEMVVATKKIEPRSLINAGSDDDLWQADIEKQLMEAHDNTAAQILRKKVWGKKQIQLTDKERLDLAKWFALFIARVPTTFESLRQRIRQDATPQAAIDLIHRNRDKYLELARQSSPRAYEGIIELLGKLAGEEWILAILVNSIRREEANYKPTDQDTYNIFLKTTDIDRNAKFLTRLHWTWFYSATGFIISDNPLCRWHGRSGRYNHGIAQQGVQITMPLSPSLSVLMQRRPRRDPPGLVYCNRKRTRRYNHRQWVSALTHLYAASPALLNPEAKYGIY